MEKRPKNNKNNKNFGGVPYIVGTFNSTEVGGRGVISIGKFH